MKWLRSFLFLVLCWFAAWPTKTIAAQEGRPPSRSTKGPAGVAGTIINSVTGEPLEGAHVRLSIIEVYVSSPPAPYGAMSDSAGHFSVSALPPASYEISLERRGFVMVRGRKGSGEINGYIELKPGEQTRDVTLAMAPQAVLSGRILDEYGDPMIKVIVKPMPVAPWKILDRDALATMTNDRGEFRLSVEPGKYYILAGTMNLLDERSQRLRNPVNTAESTYLTTYYPSATTTAAATPVEAKPGRETSGLEMRLARTSALSMSGQLLGILDCVGEPSVVDESENELSNESVYEPPVLDPLDDKSGYKFRFTRRAPGLYRVRAHCSAGDHILRSQALEVTLTDSNVENLSLTLARGPDIKDLMGKVEWTASSLRSPERKKTRTVILMDKNAFGSPPYRAANSGYAAEVAPDGTFTIKGVFPDRYRVAIDPRPENGCVMAIQLGAIPVRNSVVDLTNGAEGPRLKITLSTNGGQVTGWVTETEAGPPSSLGSVVIYRDQNDTVGLVDWPSVSLSSEGGYGFGGLRPGQYRLVATRRTFSRLDEINEFIKQHRGSGELIEIKEGEKISQDLKMPDEDADE
jgi:hypothetical protein